MNKKFEKLVDRTQGILEVVNDLVESWSYDLSKRKPGISYVNEEGNPVVDLDLACYLSSLVSKRAVVNLPRYRGARAKSHTEGEVVVSAANRHGRTIELRSNQTVWSFGVCVEDANVMTAEDVGRPRTFMIQGIEGDWHDGWDTVEILPQGLEKEVFDAFCGKDRALRFDYFIHPLRWTSVFGENFRVAKYAADTRIPDQLRFIKSEIKRLFAATDGESKVWPKTTSEPAEKTKVWAYESFIDGMELTGEYTPYPTSFDGLKEAQGDKRRLEQLQKSLRFHVRASEFSWWLQLQKAIPAEQYLEYIQGTVPADTLPKPVWAKDKEWELGYKVKRTVFARMEMEPGVFYRYRVMQKTESVARDS